VPSRSAPPVMLAPRSQRTGEAGEAPATLAAGRNEGEDHVVARLDFGNARADLFDDTSALVAGHDRVVRREVTGGEVPVGVAHAGGDHFDQNFAGFRFVEGQLFDDETTLRAVQDSGSRLHAVPPSARHACARSTESCRGLLSTIAERRQSVKEPSRRVSGWDRPTGRGTQAGEDERPRTTGSAAGEAVALS